MSGNIAGLVLEGMRISDLELLLQWKSPNVKRMRALHTSTYNIGGREVNSGGFSPILQYKLGIFANTYRFAIKRIYWIVKLSSLS